MECWQVVCDRAHQFPFPFVTEPSVHYQVTTFSEADPGQGHQPEDRQSEGRQPEGRQPGGRQLDRPNDRRVSC